MAGDADRQPVAIVGCGLIGRAWAISFARAGCAVALWDEDPGVPEVALDASEPILAQLEAHGLLDGGTPAGVRARMRAAATLEDALEGVAHVQESTPEDVEVKRAIFARLDALAAPDAVLASSTSGILPSAFTEGLSGRARCLVAHPINPPYLVPAVELVPAPWTDPAVLERTRALLVAAGHAPIVLARELEGFVVNRLQGALLEEAFRLVTGGHATVEEVDIAIREGLGLRWSFIGPFETIDLNAPGGVRDYIGRYEGLYARLFAEPTRHQSWSGAVAGAIEEACRARLPSGRLETRADWRDRRLMALAAHKRAMDRGR